MAGGGPRIDWGSVREAISQSRRPASQLARTGRMRRGRRLREDWNELMLGGRWMLARFGEGPGGQAAPVVGLATFPVHRR